MIVEDAFADGYWCPFARTPITTDSEGVAGVNRRYDQSPAKFAPCLGSGCMAWRWVSDVAPDRPDAMDGNGYCGLAGRPTP